MIPAAQRLIEPRCQQHHAQRGGKAQLQADAPRRKGVGQQDDAQRRRQSGKAVAAPPEQRRSQQEYLHDAGPYHRWRQAHHHHIEQQRRYGHGAQRPPPVSRSQQPQQRHQKRTVQAGYREQMGKSRLFHHHGVALRQRRTVADELRDQKALHRLVVPDGGGPLLHGPRRSKRQPAELSCAALPHLRLVSLIEQGVYASGRELRQLCASDIGGILPPRRAGQRLPRLQRQQLLPAIIRSLGPVHPMEPHRHRSASLRLPRPGADGAGKRRLRAAEVQHRLLHHRLIRSEIHQRRRQRPQDQLAPPEPLLRPPPQIQAQRGQRQPRRRPQIPSGPRQQQYQKQSCRKGERYGGQYAHMLSPFRFLNLVIVPDMPRRRKGAKKDFLYPRTGSPFCRICFT